MRLFEIERIPSQKMLNFLSSVHWQNTVSINQFLTDYGYRSSGHGHYSWVYAHPDEDYVIKILDKPDPCYQKFVEYSNETRSPYVPKISNVQSIKIKQTPDLYFYVIEKLIPIEKYMNPANFEFLRSLVKSVDDYYTKKRRGKDVSIVDEFLANNLDVQDAVDFVRANRLLFKTIQDVKRKFNKYPCLIDVHVGNFMIRPSDEEIVIVDPLATQDS